MSLAHPFLFRMRIRYEEPAPGGEQPPGPYWSPGGGGEGADTRIFDVYGKTASADAVWPAAWRPAPAPGPGPNAGSGPMADPFWARIGYLNPKWRQELDPENPPFGSALFFDCRIEDAAAMNMLLEDPIRFDPPANPSLVGSTSAFGIWRISSSHSLGNGRVDWVSDYPLGWPDDVERRNPDRLAPLPARLELVTPGVPYLHAVPRIGTTGLDFTRVDLTREDYSSLRLEGADFTGAELWATNFEKTLLSRAVFHSARLVYARLDYADLSGAAFLDCRADSAKFANAVLTGSSFNRCNLSQTDLTGAVLTGARFEDCEFAGAVLRGAHLAGATFYKCRFASADLGGAYLAGAAFQYCELSDATLSAAAVYGVHPATGTDFTGSQIDYPFLGATWDNLNLNGVTFNGLPAAIPNLQARHAVLTGHRLTGLDLRMADFTGADLRAVNLSRSNLDGAVFAQAILGGGGGGYPAASLGGAFLGNARFEFADLTGADLSATFWGERAVLDGAKLARTSFANAYLAGVSFIELALDGTSFAGACLVNARFRDAHCVTVKEGRTSFAGACLQGADFTGAALDGADLTNAAVALGPGTIEVATRTGWPLTVRHETLSYEPTRGLDAATGPNAICPSGAAGPCRDAKLVGGRAPTNWPVRRGGAEI